MIRLYYGIIIDGKWYNHFTLKKMQGGVFTVLDSPDKSGASRMLNIVRGCLDKVYTESGDECELKDSDFYKIKVEDAKKITREYIKTLNDGKHIFTEWFRCKRCSNLGQESFTELSENWEENESIVEYFAESKDDLRYETVLPIPFEITSSGNIKGGSFDTITREALDLGKSIDLINDNWARKNEKNMLCKKWDLEIVDIKGIDQRTFNAHVKLKGSSFSSKYLTDIENQEAMSDEKRFGMDFTNRLVRCNTCGLDIGGYADYTNFFLNLFGSKNKGHI